MTRNYLIHLSAILLLSSSIAFANSVQIKKFNALYADGGAMIAAPPIGSPTTINLFNIYYLINTGGTLTFNPTTQTLTLTSTITEIYAGSHFYLGDFGTLTFTTGALTSGSLSGYATFGGGTFTITTNGTDGLPNGTLLSGVFGGSQGPINWHEIGRTNNYYLKGFFYGTGSVLSEGGQIHQYVTSIGGNQFTVTQGATVIPEPATYALLVTGLAVLFGAARLRKSLIFRS
jgi:hypothetical protein